MRASRSIANFDSAAAMLRAIARFLKAKDFPGAGATPPLPMLGRIVNALPQPTRETLYTWGGWGEAIRRSDAGQVDAEKIARWATRHYPQDGRYPAVAIGSSSGALVHLCAALRIPWLPQTFLVPVRQHGVHPDEPRDAIEAAKEPARSFLEANPDVQLHHMHDPNQDRLMIQHMMYFRFKRLRLGDAYVKFLRERLLPGGTIIVAHGARRWSTTQVGERHVFQMGALGGVEEAEFFSGSERVADYLSRYGSHRRSWDPPPPDGKRPEAEWGFVSSLADDIAVVAGMDGFRVRHLVFEEPDDLSEFVAELYRWWYRRRGVPADRLLVESFILLDPYWTLRAGCVPLWVKFNMESDADRVERYLTGSDPYEEINMMLFSHGVESAGLAPIGRWRSILERGSRTGRFIGVSIKHYPRDFGVFTRYNRHLKTKIIARHPLPPPLELCDLQTFYRDNGGRFPVRWTDAAEPTCHSPTGF